nr:5-formyltetrahydrofolate cyclo-ligase [Neobacillus sp. Marseille-Q6967]
MMDKKTIRNQMKKTLSGLSKPLYEDYSYKISKTLFEEQEWKSANVIGITISRPPEVDTYQIIRKAWESGKKVVVPKCYPKDRQLSFRTLTEFSQLETVYYGLYEPKLDKTTEIHIAEIDLLIVPGLAYTKEGYRLGFGGGYYDRFLSHFQGQTLSLAFGSQIVEKLPTEDYDIPVSKIITNTEVINSSWRNQ